MPLLDRDNESDTKNAKARLTCALRAVPIPRPLVPMGRTVRANVWGPSPFRFFS